MWQSRYLSRQGINKNLTTILHPSILALAMLMNGQVIRRGATLTPEGEQEEEWCGGMVAEERVEYGKK